MSFILKALQKLEEEKAAQRVRPQDINRAILTAGQPAPRSFRAYLATAVVVALLLAGAGSAYLLQERSIELARKPIPAETPPKSPATALPLSSTGTPPAVRAADRDVPTGPPVTKSKLPGKALHKEQMPEANLPASAGRGATLARHTMEQAGHEQPYGPLPAGLIVNGIALQDDPAESVAVVNGKLVRRGMVIQGMKIEEILSDRVRFSGTGGRCEVRISK